MTTALTINTVITHNTLLLLLHPFNGLFSRVSRHQKGKPFWILLEQEMMGWQWHQLDHMQIICTSLQTDNHASISDFISDTLITDSEAYSWLWSPYGIGKTITFSFCGFHSFFFPSLISAVAD